MPNLLTGGRQSQISVSAGTGNILQAQRVVDMDERIHLLEPNATPLAVLLMRLRKKVTFNPRFDWMEDDLRASFDTITSAQTAASTTWDVVNPNYFRVNDIVKVPRTGEEVLVTAVGTTTSRSPVALVKRRPPPPTPGNKS